MKIAQLKAQLRTFLRAASRGHSIVVCEGDKPIARLAPYAETNGALTSRLPLRSWGGTQLPHAVSTRVDSLAVLLEERQSTR